MLMSEPMVAHAVTASETVSFILIIAVMAILLIRIINGNIAVAHRSSVNLLTEVPVRKINEWFSGPLEIAFPEIGGR